LSFLSVYWNKYKGLFITSVCFVVAEAVFDLLQPRFMAMMIDNGVGSYDPGYVIRMGLVMVGVVCLSAGCGIVRNVVSSTVSQKVGAEMRQDMFVKIQKISVSDAEGFDGGSLVTRLTNDQTQLTFFINSLMRNVAKAPITVVGSVVMSLTLNMRVGAIVLGVVAFAMFTILLSMKLTYPVFAKVQAALDKLNTTVREYLMGIRLVKAFGRQISEARRFAAANDDLVRINTKAARILGVFGPFTGLAVHLGIAMILIAGSRWVGKGDMKVGEVVAFISYMSQLMFSFFMTSNILNIFVRARASYNRIREVMDLSDAEDLGEGDRYEPIRKDASAVVFENVTFTYPLSTGDSAISGVSFRLERGQTFGIIGPTGSGKSTLTSLLLRFYRMDTGSIQLFGEDIGDMTPKRLREHVAIVPQTPMLFSGTIRENILWGNPGATDDEILGAAKDAQALEFIEAAENGFDTWIGQGGVNFSGGQKQRLSIARALVSKPDVLILDDCTSALDSLTEAKVLSAVRARSENLACVLISQRISTVRKTDNILVLNHGAVAGCGSHDALVKGCEVYRDTCKSQIGEGDY